MYDDAIVVSVLELCVDVVFAMRTVGYSRLQKSS